MTDDSDYNEHLKRGAEYEARIKQENLDQYEEAITMIRDHCLESGLLLDNSCFDYTTSVGVTVRYPNILSILCPELIIDKEGLTDISTLDVKYKRRFKPGYLQSDEYIIMAHPYFRRGCWTNSGFHIEFLGAFWTLNVPNISRYIALDKDCVRIDVDGPEYSEFDRWYASPFSKQIETISDGGGKYRPPLDIKPGWAAMLFADVYCLDIKWVTTDRVKVFYAEEIKNETAKIEFKGEICYPARYIHSEYDLQKKCFTHFDGAIHLYNEGDYLKRRDSDLDYNSKNNYKIKGSSQKLFKINGGIDVDTWVKLTSLFLAHNPLVFEYFDGAYPEEISSVLNTIKANNLNP